MELPILHQDEEIIVVDKPAGMVVHPGNGTQTSVPTVSEKVAHLVVDDDGERPGIVHRLDKDTSGVLLIARTPETKSFLQDQFKQRSVSKVYLTAVRGRLKRPRARLEWPLGRSHKNPMKRTVRPDGKEAITEYEVIDEREGNSLLRLNILTGRTHQIRAHMQYLGHPVLGDILYGGEKTTLGRHFLHAHQLTFVHPDGTSRTFTSELPKELHRFWYNEARDGLTTTPSDN